MNYFKQFLISISLIAGLTLPLSGFACSLVLQADNSAAVVVGRNMDWFEDMQESFWVLPRGIMHQGLQEGNSLNWTSKYGSIVTMSYDKIQPIASDGMNEHGLSAHLLSLAETNYGIRDESLPGLSVTLWAQFYLDNFQTVDEAVRYTQTTSFQIQKFFFPKTQGSLKLHLALEDAKGDSAIIEYIDGKPQIFHDKSFTVLTNSPTYDKQLENLKQYKGFGGDKPLPGTTSPADRFVRASLYRSHLASAQTVQEEIRGLLSILQNVGEPYEAQSPENRAISPTTWRTFSDLTNKVYYFTSMTNFNMVWVNLNTFNLHAGAPIMRFDANQTKLAGDVSHAFTQVTMK